jgi:putative tryptophan/tyrosine transport system substrate-binding protein
MMMRRRDLILGLGGAICAPLAARAQQKPMPVIGFLFGGLSSAAVGRLAAFHQGLGETGYVEGRNLTVEFRWAENRYDQLPALAADLAGRPVAVIAAPDLPGALAAKAASTTIPIVFISGGDAVEDGLVNSLARPSGNLTGVSLFTHQLGAKRWQLIGELVPDGEVFGLLVNPQNANADAQARDAQEAARAAGRRILVVRASSDADLDTAFALWSRNGPAGWSSAEIHS